MEGDFASTRDIWQHLKTFLVVTTQGEEDATGT